MYALNALNTIRPSHEHSGTLYVVRSPAKHTMCVGCCHGQEAADSLHCLPAENIAMTNGSYYSQRTLYFTLGQNDPLYKSCFCQQAEAKRTLQQAEEGERDKAEKKPRVL